MAIKTYFSSQLRTACERYNEVAGGGRHEFLVWLGFDTPWIDDMNKWGFDQPFATGVGRSAHKKMELILNDNTGARY